MQQDAQRQVLAFLHAVRSLIDPNRGRLAATTPYILTGGVPLDALQLIRGGARASEFDADLIHLEFAPGAEADGPVEDDAGRQEALDWVIDRVPRPAIVYSSKPSTGNCGSVCRPTGGRSAG